MDLLLLVTLSTVIFALFSAVDFFKEEHYFPDLVTSLLHFMIYEYCY